MPSIKYAGVSPAELDELVNGDRWGHWCLAEPDLAAMGSLRDLRTLRGESEDRILGALIRLAAADGGDDHLAAIAVIHQLGGSVRTIGRRFWNLAGGDIDGIIVGAMWEQIRSFDWKLHTQHYGAVITHETRNAVRALLMPEVTRTRPKPALLINPQSWLADVLFEQVDRASEPMDGLDSGEQLARFLDWATSVGIVDDTDNRLLLSLVTFDRDNPAIPKWLRGACSMAAVEQLATERGVCPKSIHRARDRVIAKLRSAAPAYLEEVA